MRPKLSDEEVKQITDFLRQQEGLAHSLLEWLNSAPSGEIRAELLQRLSWEGGSESVDVVERVVQGKLASFAEARGAPPAASKTKGVATRLFSEVWKVLRSDGVRSLDRFRLEELWEEEVRVSIPQSAVDALLQGARSASNADRAQVEDFERGAPPAPMLVAQRSALVDGARSILASKGFINLHGSALTGKTTLAKLVLGPDSTEWIWWSAARRQPAEIASSLFELRRSLALLAGENSVVLDDLDFAPLALKQYEEVVAELFLILRARRGRLLITSQRDIPSSLQHVLGCDGGQAVFVPEFDLPEIADLAAQFGCPEEAEHRLWPRVVLVNTLGHPQLVAASLLLLRQRNWPRPSTAEIATALEKTEAEKSDARQLLAALPEGQRILLHRLSVFPNIFKRSHAVEIGAWPPPLVAPGDLFGPLIGPWVEPLHSGYFALSALLLGSARSTFAAEEFRTLQNAAAKILITPEDRTTIEGAMAFQLVWETKNEEAITGLMGSWMSMEQDLFGHIADGLRWFTGLSTERGAVLYPTNRHLSFFLRGLQLRVGVTNKAPNLRAIVTAWLMEVSSPPLSNDSTNRAVLAIQVLPYSEIRLSGQLVISLLLDVHKALKIYPELGDTFRANKPQPDADGPIAHNLFDSLVLFLIWRCDNKKFLAGLIAAMAHIPDELHADIVERLRGYSASVHVALDRVWLTEASRAEPEWDQCLVVLESAFHAGVSWGCEPMVIGCIRGIAVILDEYQHKQQDAHTAITRLAAIAGTDSHEIADRQASVFFSEANYSAAEENWTEALSKWPAPSTSFDHSAAFAARGAAISAAKQQRWDVAAAWFLEIPDRLPVPKETYFIAGAYADAGYALWKAQRRREAVSSLVEAWHYADSLSEGKDDLRAFNTRKIIAHVIAWLHSQVTDIEPGPHFEPLPGMCSSPNLPEQAREMPADNPDNLWLFLIRIERVLGAGDRAAKLALDRVSNAANLDTRALGLDEAIIHNLLNGELTHLPSNVVTLARAIKSAAQTRPYPSGNLQTMDPETFYHDDDLIGVPVFVGALLSAAVHEQDWRELVLSWRKSVNEFSNASSWTGWFDEVQAALGAQVHDAARIARESGHPRSTFLLAWLNLSMGADVSPEDLFLAHARWITETHKTTWLKDLGSLYCKLVERAWSRVISRPALLQAPKLSVPGIEAAANLEHSGWPKAARILLAASAAVATRLSPEVEVAVRRLSA